jgi:hypothetical protein
MSLRFVVKQYSQHLAASEKDYVWYEMGFFGYRGSQGKVVLLCLDLPLVLRDCLQRTIVSCESPITTNMHWLSSTFLSQILHLYDHSVWTLRSVVREIEEVRAPIA